MKLGITVRSEGELLFIRKQYFDYLKEHELLIIYPYLNTHAYAQCDGFVIIGGDDVAPKYYNEENYTSNPVEEMIDELDLRVIDFAVKNNKPILGICRGLQILNVYFNGSLKQNILNHKEGYHKVILVEDFLDFPSSETVNTFHHQSIKKLGENLKVLYYSPDGEIELIVHKKMPIIATQFHPEKELTNELSIKVLQYYNNLLNIYK